MGWPHKNASRRRTNVVDNGRGPALPLAFFSFSRGYRDGRPQSPLRSRANQCARSRPSRDASGHGGSPVLGLPGAGRARPPGPEEDLQDHERAGFIFPASGTGAWEASLSQHPLAGRQGARRRASACSAISGSTWRSVSASRSRCSTPSGARARRSSAIAEALREPTSITSSRRCCSLTTRPRPASPATSPGSARR